jgi:predicted nucleic acid-binding protein
MRRSSAGPPAEGPYFLDTNLLVYRQFDPNTDPKAEMARALIDQGLTGALPLRLSPQILREFYAVITRSPKLPFSYLPAQALRAIKAYLASPIQLVYPTEATLSRALRIAVRKRITGLRIHDLYIAATMLDHEMRYIFTENAADFSGIPGITPINPFMTEPWKSTLRGAAPGGSEQNTAKTPRQK